ncbi:MAG: prepilin peptidase [Clostridia bacterium]|nr:prepilin peptidase [Clostridia bacterium]
MIRPILPPVLPPITPIVKVAAADFVLQIAAGAVILGIFTLAVWIILRHSKKDLNEPIIPAALVAYAGVGLILLLVHGISIAAIQGLILCAILLWASLSDIAKHEVPDFITAAILILAFVGFEPANLPSMLIGAAVVFIPQLLVSVLRPKRAIGGADIKISTALAFLLGAEKGIFALLVGMLLGVIIMLIVRKIRKETNKEPFALVPFLSFGAMLAFII